MFKLLLVAIFALGAKSLGIAARPTATRASCPVMAEMTRRGALIAAAVLASGGSPAYAAELSDTVARLDAKASERNCHGAPEKHIPLLSMERTTRFNVLSNIVLTVPHEMQGHKPHFIEYLWLKDANTGDVLAVKEFTPSVISPPSMSASIAKGRRILPMLYCNVHGLWEGEEFITA